MCGCYQLGQVLQLSQFFWQALQTVLLQCHAAELIQRVHLHRQSTQLVMTGTQEDKHTSDLSPLRAMCCCPVGPEPVFLFLS